MTIACIGWGSLIHEPRGLPLAGGWEQDGPSLPLEFARESADGRMTLVIVDHDAPTTTLWAPLAVQTLEDAVVALADREGCSTRAIGRWPNEGHGPAAGPIGEWARRKELAGVVWTALKAGFRDARGTVPTLDQIARHLDGLSPAARGEATRYVRMAPGQVATPLRRDLERILA